MSISDKTRKTLWGRSGNRCAICKIELVVTPTEESKNLNIGDECHLISEKPNGPRHTPDYNDYDGYDNLILLCRNHHRTIDELYETYTTDIIKAIKSNHEDWVKSSLDVKDNNKTDVEFLPRIHSGKELVAIISDVYGYEFNHDELNNQDEVNLVGAFLQNLEDWGDLIGMDSFESGRRTQLGFDLNNQIRDIEENGFFVFGKRQSKVVYENSGKWEVATVMVIRQNNTQIIDFEKLGIDYSNDKKGA
ncbi:HNH endonuclease [Chitinophaga polysaccharea]|uniref:HNH endonuclease n=1 Tax=Chitinophaga polysaccharea TaxID=1293035 RepID=UPI0011576223|nr:hypothetical protein [Chitinophaga polysaccharea]